jgi:hypothetical protein
MTHRQFTTWQAWLAQRRSTPNRSDYYLMQIAFEARNILRALVGSGQQLHLEDFRLQFSHRQQQQQGGMVQSPEEMKSVILGGLGIAPPT